MLRRLYLLPICFFMIGVCLGRPQQTGAVGAAPTPAGPGTPVVINPAAVNGAGANGTLTPVKIVPVKPGDTVPPRVVKITVLHSGSAKASDAQSIGRDTNKVVYAGSMICFEVSNARAFLRAKPSDQARVVLYANGIEMPGITSDWNSQVTTIQIQQGHLPSLKDTEKIIIQLLRNPATQNSWNYLYQNTGFTNTYFDVKNASVGWEHTSALDKGLADNSLTIEFYNWWEFTAWSILYVVIIFVFVWLALKTNVLRVNKTGPYSLSNTQLLFWTSLVMGAFIYTLLLTDISMSFNTSILYMLGISLGTTGAATAIDQNKINNQSAVPKKNQGFFKDVLTDGDSYSIQRVQSFAWNVILGLYFITYTIKNKTMPEFSTTMLLLAGFSSSSYLAGKVPENTQNTVAAQAVQAAQTAQAAQAGQPAAMAAQAGALPTQNPPANQGH